MVQVVAEKEIIPVSEDIMFKSMFGKEETIGFLQEFLRKILGELGKNLEVVSIENPNLIPDHPELKLAMVDVLVKLRSGEIVQVEMQNQVHTSFDKRMIYYHSGLFSNQQVKGDNYSTIKRTISICILNDNYFKDSKKVFHDKFFYRSEETGRILTKISEIHILELTKLPEESDEPLVNWLKLIRAKTREELRMLAEKDPVIKEAVSQIEYFSADETMRFAYQQLRKREMDRKSLNATEVMEAHEGGIEQGIEQEKVNVAKLMISVGEPIDKVTMYTGLTKEQIEAIQ